jgi:ribosomal protein S25
MISRCSNKNNLSYKKWYGAHGITVCSRWRERNKRGTFNKWAPGFLAFLEDMGDKPDPSYQLDRINPAKNYEPSNCRWATTSQQASNKKPYKRPSAQGEKNKNAVLNKDTVKKLRKDRERGLSYSELSQIYKISKATVAQIVTRKTWTHI